MDSGFPKVFVLRTFLRLFGGAFFSGIPKGPLSGYTLITRSR